MSPTIESVRDGALDRALAHRDDARSALVFAGLVAAVDDAAAETPALPAVLPAVLRLPAALATLDTAVPPEADRVDAVDDAAARGAALAVEHRNVSPGHAATLAEVPADRVAAALDDRADEPSWSCS